MSMRKQLQLLIALLLALPIGMLAQELRFVDQPDGTVKLSYRVKRDDWGNLIRISNSYSGDIVIPSTYNGKTVTAIGDLAFDDCVNLTSVSIPNTVKVIEENAFRGCKSLIAVSIPASVDSIGAYAFYQTALKRVTLEDGSRVLKMWRGGTWNSYTPFSSTSIETLYVGRNLVSGQNAFRGFTTIKYLTFGEQVTGVCADEFNGCKGLRSIDFGQSITNIGNNAFYNCDTLGTVTLPESVGIIGDAAFCDCEMLANINIPSKVRVIHASTFQYCKNLAAIVIPANIDSIGAYAFHFTGLKKVTLEDGDRMLKTWRGGTWNSYTPFSDSPIETLYVGRNLQKDMGPFRGMKTIKELTLSDKVTSVLDYEFNECRGLRRVSFGQNITDIGNNAFMNCDTLVAIKLPEAVTRIGKSAFNDCDTLSRVNIPSNVKLIDESAFYGCKKLEEIIIPANVDSIAAWAFNNTGLKKVTLEDDDKVLKTWRGGTWNSYTPFSGSPIETLYVGRNFVKDMGPFRGLKTIKELTLSDKVTSVLDYEFNECRGLRRVSFGQNIKEIGNAAFMNCDTLVAITLPESLTHIGNSAFRSCDTLTHANIPSKVTLIGESAFNECKYLAEIIIPASVDSIAPYAFSNTGMKRVIIEDGDKVLRTWRGGTWNGYTPFSDSPIETLYVGRNFVKDMGPFRGLKTIKELTLSDKVTSVLDYEFNDCRGLRRISFGQNIKEIGNNAFQNCDTLMSITLPESLTRIGNSAFRSCDTLSRANIPSKVTFIGENAFSECRYLSEIVIPASVETIGAYAFYLTGLKRVVLEDGDKVLSTWRGGTWNGYTSFSDSPIETLYVGRNFVEEMGPFRGMTTIKTLTLSNKVTSVLDNEFKECRGLRSVSFGKNITAIGNYAFFHCDSLPSIKLPQSVTRIGNCAFQNCDALSSANIPSKVSEIGESAFNSCENLTEITIPASVESIGAWAFSDCGLKEVTIKNSSAPLKTWRGGTWNGYTSFSGNPIETLYVGRNFEKDKAPFRGLETITKLYVGSTVTHLYENEYNDCKGLRQIYSYNTTPPVCDKSNVFNNVDKEACKLYVLEGCVAAYKAADVWKEFFAVDVTEDYQEKPDTPDDPDPQGETVDEFTLWYTLDIGGTVSYKLSEKPQVRLLGEETTVTSSRGVATFLTKDIWKFTLSVGSSDPVGIEETFAPVQTEAQPSISRESDALVFSGCRPGEPVVVYTTGGRLVSQYRIGDDGSLTLSLSSLGQGLYIVKAGSANIKIMKK